MQIELKIKEILERLGSVERKVEEICEFMNWDKDKLTEAIIKHGTSGDKQRGAIIEEFWAKEVLESENRQSERRDK